MIGFGVSLFLFAIGAILTWAVTAQVNGIDLGVAGIVLMLVGGIGFLWSVIVSLGDDKTLNQ